MTDCRNNQSISCHLKDQAAVTAHHDHVEPDPGVLGTPQQHTVVLLVYCQPDSEVASLGGQVHVLNVGEFDLPSSGISHHNDGNISENLLSITEMDCAEPCWISRNI